MYPPLSDLYEIIFCQAAIPWCLVPRRNVRGVGDAAPYGGVRTPIAYCLVGPAHTVRPYGVFPRCLVPGA